MESKSQIVARSYYSDVDVLYLKVQTDGYIAFSSSMNNTMFGDSLAIVPVRGVDSKFSVSAFYSDSLDDDVFAQCRDSFEACRDAMADRTDHGEVGNAGFSMEGFWGRAGIRS